MEFTQEGVAMSDGEQGAVVEALEAQGFQVEVRDTGRPGCDRFVCGLARGSLAKGYFGSTEAEALRKAVAAREVFPQPL